MIEVAIVKPQPSFSGERDSTNLFSATIDADELLECSVNGIKRTCKRTSFALQHSSPDRTVLEDYGLCLLDAFRKKRTAR